MASVPALKTPQFVSFPVAHDPNFGDTDDEEVRTNPLWSQAARDVVYDPEESRQQRLKELREELKNKQIRLVPGDDNQLLAFLRAGQGHVSRALHVVEVFLQYQQYDKRGNNLVDRHLLISGKCQKLV